MEYKRFENKYVIRLEKGEDVVESVRTVCKENNIKLGTVSGIGAVNKAVIGLFETGTKEYHSRELSGDMEITCLTGNVSEMDGEVYLHLHVTLADSSYRAFGGHLSSAVISATGEVVIDVIPGKAGRKFDDKIGLNLLDLAVDN